MPAIYWVSCTSLDKSGSAPAISINNNNTFLSAYVSTAFPSPQYRGGQIVTEPPFGNPNGVIMMQDNPTNGPETFGTNTALSVADSGNFLAVSQKFLPDQQLNYVAGNVGNGPVTFKPIQVLNIGVEMADPGVVMLDDSRALVSGTDYQFLGTTRNLYVTAIARNDDQWTPGAPLIVDRGDQVVIDANNANVGVILYNAAVLSRDYKIRLGNVTSGAGSWGTIDVSDTIAGDSSISLAINDNNQIILMSINNNLLAYSLGQIDLANNAIYWTSVDTYISPDHYSPNEPQQFNVLDAVAVSMNNNFAVVSVTCTNSKNRVQKMFCFHGHLVS